MSPADRYRNAGVDLAAADAATSRIARAVQSTKTALARGQTGAFGGAFRLPPDIPDPTIVTSTDGVGTKVLVAIRAGVHDTIGEDLVNHCVNDILVHGAKPVAFQDYIAACTIEHDMVGQLVDGIARGCRAHGMMLTGGETAAMPDLYEKGHYDLAGTIIGVVAEGAMIHGDEVRSGQVLVAYESSGLHTNGYTLARRIVFEEMSLDVDSIFPGTDSTVADILLRVHMSYWPVIKPVIGRFTGMAHITGGGIEGNVSRILPHGMQAVVDTASWEVPGVFRILMEAGGVSRREMYRVFNMGVGMIAVAPREDADEIMRVSLSHGVRAWVAGEIGEGNGVKLAGV